MAVTKIPFLWFGTLFAKEKVKS